MATKQTPAVLQQQQTRNLPAQVKGGALSTKLSPAWAKELAEAAKNESAKETPTVTGISFRSGVMSVSGNPIPGNTMTGIVMETAYERCLYEGPFDPGKVKNPICFALSYDGEEMAPHENSLHPQNETCDGCAMNEWGSAGEGRRGKACKEVRRLALIPADTLESTEDIKTAELAMAKVPVTSVKNWSNYVHTVGAVHNVPFWAVISRMTLRPHIKNQFEVMFDIEETVDEDEALAALRQRREHIESFIMAPYPVATEEEETAQPVQKATAPKAPVKSARQSLKKF